MGSGHLIKYRTILLSVLIAATLYAIIRRISDTQYLAVDSVSFTEKSSILVIDPGHGGEDGGAVSVDGLVESGVNLDIAGRLRELCSFLGIQSIMTREGERLAYPPELLRTAERKRWDTKRRTELINGIDNAVLYSIHQNNFPDSGPRGPQAFYAKTAGSKELAERVHDSMRGYLCPDSRRLAAPAPKEVYIMSNITCPAVLVECAFLSNPEDCLLLRQDKYRIGIAAILAASFLQYTEELNEVQNGILLHGMR